MDLQLNLSYADEVRSLAINNSGKQGFVIGAFGRRSYINQMLFTMNDGNEVVNIQIGDYSSLGRHISAFFNRNHDHQAISTSALLPIRKDFRRKGEIVIGNDVWIGDFTMLHSSIRIGDGAVVAAGTIVTKDVPPYAIVGGNPMRIIKYRYNEEQIKQLRQVKWWQLDNDIIDANKELFTLDLEEFVKEFEQYKNNGDKDSNNSQALNIKTNSQSILLIPDYNDPYPVYVKAIKEYLETYTKDDDISLIIYIEPDTRINKRIEELEQIIKITDDMPDIVVANEQITDESCLFKSSDYFITTRSRQTMRRLDLCDEYEVAGLSGVDQPVFGKITVKD